MKAPAWCRASSEEREEEEDDDEEVGRACPEPAPQCQQMAQRSAARRRAAPRSWGVPYIPDAGGGGAERCLGCLLARGAGMGSARSHGPHLGPYSA